jgi:hypothetical protein
MWLRAGSSVGSCELESKPSGCIKGRELDCLSISREALLREVNWPLTVNVVWISGSSDLFNAIIVGPQMPKLQSILKLRALSECKLRPLLCVLWVHAMNVVYYFYKPTSGLLDCLWCVGHTFDACHCLSCPVLFLRHFTCILSVI